MPLDRESRSVIVVLLLTLSALAAGWVVREEAIDPVRRVSGGGIAVDLPADWLAASGTADVAITAHSLNPVLERMQIGLLTIEASDSLEAIATNLSAAHARRVDGYRVLGEGADVVNDRPAHAVAYAFLEEDDGSLPVVVQGQAYYVRFGDNVVVATVEADTAVFPHALDRFSAVLQSVEITGD